MRNDTNDSPLGLEQPSYVLKQQGSKLTAKTVKENNFVHAKDVTKKDGPFYCPDTLGNLIVRKCKEKADRFCLSC